MAAVSPFPREIDRQPRSKVSTGVADRQIPMVTPGERIDVDAALVHRQSSLLAAIQLCLQAAGIADKEAHLALGIDAGHWSRMLRGDAHFPLHLLGPLMDMAGNEAPLEWLAHSRGYELRPLETELERQVREEQERNAKLADENRMLRELLVGRAR
jgi:hypothetical protein